MSLYNIYMGIDPGQSGGITTVTDTGTADATKMPQTEHDINSLIEYINSWDNKLFCIIEAVHSFPGQGVASSFKFGRGYGFLRGCLVANKIAFKEVPPRVWQKGLGVVPRKKDTESKTQFKNRLKGMAQQMHPELKITLATADSILIAEYAKLIYK